MKMTERAEFLFRFWVVFVVTMQLLIYFEVPDFIGGCVCLWFIIYFIAMFF